jgi:uncharacterized membrane protein (DUF2068 family)
MTEGSPLAGAAPAAPARPVAITIICVIGSIGALIILPLIFSSAVASIAPWYPVVLAASAVIGLACMVGLWQMRRWAVYVYTAMFAVVQLLFMATGLWTPRSLIIPAAVIVIMFIYLPRMR